MITPQEPRLAPPPASPAPGEALDRPQAPSHPRPGSAPLRAARRPLHDETPGEAGIIEERDEWEEPEEDPDEEDDGKGMEEEDYDHYLPPSLRNRREEAVRPAKAKIRRRPFQRGRKARED